jgi:drug/metabolite transporter (DMT)-like permease
MSELPDDPVRGIGLKLLSVLVFSGMAICVKFAAGSGIPPGERVFFRSLFAVPVILAWLAWQYDLTHGLATGNPAGHLWRGLVGSAGMGLNFTALGLLPLPEATALGFLAPLLIVIFAALLLGEQVRAFRLGAVVVGLVGVLIMLAPRMGGLEGTGRLESVGALAALLGAVCVALAQVFTRKLVQTEATAAIVFYFSLIAAALSLVTLPFGWVLPGPRDAAILVGSGLLGGVGQILLTQSYRYAQTGVVAPFSYASMLFALVFGYLIFGEVPTVPMLAGAGLIITAGLFIMWRERRLGVQHGPSRAVNPQG